jgi:hypothetical protein
MEHSPPEPSGKDIAHTAVRAVVSSVPLVGGPAVELFNLVVTPPIEKRRQEWMRAIGEGLQQLEEKQKTVVEDLKANDVFIDTVLQASQAVVRTSQNDKKEALRNAVLNAALPHPPSESRQHMFISWVETYTVWHLRLLKLFSDPIKWYEERRRQPPQYVIAGSLGQMLCDAYPDLRSERDFYEKVAMDLYHDGLFRSEHLHVNMSGQGVYEKRATPLAEEFLQFIADPIKEAATK